ncbi:MBL fold metallo-hydrolase [Actinokineospora sp. NPDC004072]
MAAEQRKLLHALLEDAARRVLQQRPDLGGTDPSQFAAMNTPQLLHVIARSPLLRATLAEAHAAELATAHDLLRDLVSADSEAAEDAARALSADPNRVDTKTRSRTSNPAIPATKDDRAARRAARNLAQARAARDRARVQFDYAIAERDAVRLELAAAQSDLAEATAVIDALRGQLAAAQARTAAIATDIAHAARVLIEATRPQQNTTGAADRDPRDHETQTDPGPTSDPLIKSALDRADLVEERFLAVLCEIVEPTPTSPQLPVEAATTAAEIELLLTPLGGDTEIGGSCLLVEAGGIRVLVDAGMDPKRSLREPGPRDIHLAMDGPIDAVVITHAHNDHAGYVPAVAAANPGMDIFCTPDTAALLPAMWADSLKFFNRGTEAVDYAEQLPPPYTAAEVRGAQSRVRELEYGRTVELAPGFTIELFPAGHILGAAGVVISAGSDRIAVTGDVSDLPQATTPGLVVPDSARGCDLLVIESTNCRPGGSHRSTEVDNFVSTVAEVVTAGGRVLVPAFALGRAQEIALIIRNRLPDVPVLIDGMAREITRIYERQTADRDQPLRIFGDNVREVPVTQRSELIASFRRGVIVTPSGMLTGGPAVQWARSILPDHRAALLVTGYQDAEAPGKALLGLGSGSVRSFDLDGRPVEVKARVAKFGLSAHADREGLTSIIDSFAPAQVMLVHGHRGAQREYSAFLRDRGHQVVRAAGWSR